MASQSDAIDQLGVTTACKQSSQFLGDFFEFAWSKLDRRLIEEIEQISKPRAAVNQVENRTGMVTLVFRATMNHSIVHQIDIA